MLSIAFIATLVTVVGASIYVVGLLSLVWPIQNKFTRNAPAAWYVVSLIPRTVVVGHGARILWGRPLRVAAYYIAVFPILLLVIALSERIGGFFRLSEWLQEIMPAILLLLLGVFLIRRYGVRVLRVYFPIDEDSPHTPHLFISHILGLIIANLGLAFIIGIPVQEDLATIESFGLTGPGPWHTDTFAFQASVNWEVIFQFIAIWFVAAFVISLPYISAMSPPLPMIDLTLSQPLEARSGATEDGTNNKVGEKEDKREQQVNARLVAHTDGLWHVFVDRKLMSIPDSQVTIAEILPQDTLGEDDQDLHAI